MLQLLKKLYPESKLAVVAPESSAWILKNVPFIDQLYSYPQPKSFNLKSIKSIFIQLYIFCFVVSRPPFKSITMYQEVSKAQLPQGVGLLC
jgi:hypothetical protein